jgi:heme-degrading monooxygenase HmoA
MTSNPTHCIEVVVYKVKSAAAATAARRAVRPHIEAFPGFLGWQALISSDDPLSFTDIVTWASLADAKSAGEKVMADPHCAPFMAEIAEVISMGHYV